MTARHRVLIAGGGPAGSLLAILLARRGAAPVVYERDAEFTGPAPRAGRSINLALAARGVAALRAAGALDAVEPGLIPMRGRMLHEAGCAPELMPYGQRRDEIIHSVSRAQLNLALFEIASGRHGIEYRFEHRLTAVDAAAGHATFETPHGASSADADFIVAADGAGSAVRKSLAAQGAIEAAEHVLDHGYKELTIPAAAGEFALDPNALHIWPRGGFMLIALPNPDRSFTATLFLALHGEPSFEQLDRTGPEDFFAAEFPDAAGLVANLSDDFGARPVGRLGTVTAEPWSAAGRVLLIGDAAHAIVPFHGQGMNAAFEDCLELDSLIAAHGEDYARVAAEFERRRAHNARAIAEMALENYDEMRANVREPKFHLRRALAFELERRYPDRFIPRYSMVMFHTRISYTQAQARGRIQQSLLDELTRDAEKLDDIDLAHAGELVEARLSRVPRDEAFVNNH